MHVLPEGGEIDWPAWVQAIGSIIAILFSTALAICVPLHIRRLDQRDEAGRALRTVESVGLLEVSLVKTLTNREAVGAGGTPLAKLVSTQAAQISARLGAVAVDNLGPEGTAALAVFESVASILAHVVEVASAAPEPLELPLALLSQINQQVESHLANLDGLVLFKDRGVWRTLRPELGRKMRWRPGLSR